MDLILEKQELTYLEWSRVRHSSGTAGSFLKAETELGAAKIYYKLSNYDSLHGVVGHECVNELIVDRLLTILGVEHLRYQLIHADILVDGKQIETYLCASENFRRRGEEKIALEDYYELEKTPADKDPLMFCVNRGWGDYICRMLVVDYLILNRDRHGANIEVLRDSKTRTVRLAPLFDHGLSLLAPCRTEAEIAAFNVMENKRIQSFVGSQSAEDNLSLIPKDGFPGLNALQETDRTKLLAGLDGVVPELLLSKIWEMIWRRWRHYEDLCHRR